MVHLIGANGYEEQYGIQKWGLVLGLLPSASFDPELCFVGPEVDESLPKVQTATLSALKGRRVTVRRCRGLYHQQQHSLPPPDVVLAQNAGLQNYLIHWAPTLQVCRQQKLKLYITAFDSAENLRNLECVDFCNAQDEDDPLLFPNVADPSSGRCIAVRPWSTGRYRRSASDGGARRLRFLVYKGRNAFPTLNIAHCDERAGPAGASSTHLDGTPEEDTVSIYASNFFALALDYSRQVERKEEKEDDNQDEMHNGSER